MLQDCYRFAIPALQLQRILKVEANGGGRNGVLMFSPMLSIKALFLVSLIFLSPTFAFCDPQGIVDYSIEWGPVVRSDYTFVFSGIVSREGHPCPNARVELDLETATEGIVTESALAGDDGRYQIAITITASPEQSSNWKLQARSGGIERAQTGEAEGRVILLEGQTSIIVDRPLNLVQA